MGSSHDSRYWVCPHCCQQFDYEARNGNHPDTHDDEKCRKRKIKDQNNRGARKNARR